jgi:hypothetical protein
MHGGRGSRDPARFAFRDFNRFTLVDDDPPLVSLFVLGIASHEDHVAGIALQSATHVDGFTLLVFQLDRRPKRAVWSAGKQKQLTRPRA